MNMFNQLRKTKVVAIKNFDEELYRLVKMYASLEGRTISSIFEEAVRYWMKSREDYEEIRLWVSLEEAYRENLRVLKEKSPLLKKQGDGYALICNGSLVGIFSSYEEAAKRSQEVCKVHALIVKLPHEEEVREMELGFPW